MFQENVRYRSLIRRHVDIEVVQKRIRTNKYTSAEFFRDLLLLCNNALVVYPKNSVESISAVHLRNLISKEMASTLRKSPQSRPQPVKAKPRSNPGPLPPLAACGRRGSNVKRVESGERKREEEGKSVMMSMDSDQMKSTVVSGKKKKKKQSAAEFLNRLKGKSRGGGAGDDERKMKKKKVIKEESKERPKTVLVAGAKRRRREQKTMPVATTRKRGRR